MSENPLAEPEPDRRPAEPGLREHGRRARRRCWTKSSARTPTSSGGPCASAPLATPTPRALFAAADADPARAAAVLAGALELREALFRVFVAARAGEAADEATWRCSTRAARTLGHQRVARARTGSRGRGRRRWRSWSGLLWPVVRDAAELLVAGELRRVGKCCGDNCDWLYLDTSRNRSRRWCDMQSCGNRAKARRHYHRAKGGA